MSTRWLGIAGATALISLTAASATDRLQRRPAFCGAAAASRWSADGSTYVRSAVFGQAADGWLIDLTGIAATEHNVFLYDATGARVHVLSPMLRPVHSFGRKGAGPGELAVSVMRRMDPHRHFTANSIAVDDTLVYVHDGRNIEAFRHDGSYVDRVAAATERMVKFSLGRLQPTRHGLLYSFDSLDVSGTGKRRLQTWRVLRSGTELVHSVPLWGPVVVNGRYTGWSRDPRPLWGAFSHCLAWSDGVSHMVVRTNLVSTVADTVALPTHDVPPGDYDPSITATMLRDMGRTPPPPRPRDAPLWRWSGLIIDPDGHIWVRPWTPDGRLETPVYRIDPQGNVHLEDIPEFPMAFGPPGVFYARDKDADTDEILVVRYDRRATNN